VVGSRNNYYYGNSVEIWSGRPVARDILGSARALRPIKPTIHSTFRRELKVFLAGYIASDVLALWLALAS